MKQKYLILNDKKNKQFKIQEFAELNKQMLSLLCEEAYDYETIESAVSAGKDELIEALRTNNMYPPGIYAEQIANAVAELYTSQKQDALELFFDDINLLTKNLAAIKSAKPVEDESAALDDMLDDEYDGSDESYNDKEELNKINSTLKIDDDDYADSDDGN